MNRKFFTDVRRLKWPRSLRSLGKMPPLVQPWHYEIDYIHSYGENSPFFVGLATKKLLGTECKKCRTRYATPRLSCMQCGGECGWFQLPKMGRIHSWTKCYFGSEAFLNETPYFLVLVEFEGVDTLLLSRLRGVKEEKEVSVGMPVEAKFVKKPKYSITDVWFEIRR